jgi:cell division protein FtsZ
MVASGIRSVDFIAANTDLQDLKTSLAPHKIQLGGKLTRGLGAGAKPEIGRESAIEDQEAIREHLAGSDMVFITAGMGGGTGTGAAPIIAELAREMGCLTVGVVTKPFKFEGRVRLRNCEEGILNLRKHVDTLIVIPNDNLLLLANKKTSIVEAFTMADDVLRVAIQGISDLICKDDYLINVDFADVKTIMSDMGQAIMGTGIGTGDNRALEAAEKAIHSPLLDDCRIDGAKGILINVTGPQSLTLYEVNEAAHFITDNADDDANIIFGAIIDETLPDDQIEVTVIATGFNGAPIRDRAGSRAAAEAPRKRSAFHVYNSARLEPAPEEEAREAELMPPPPANLGEDGGEDPFQGFDLSGAGEEEESAPRDGEDVYELKDPILEPVETKPQIPVSYRPEEKRGAVRNGQVDTDLDIPAFIRNRSARFRED